jgi:uncharacterized membrane protein YphA (DoxX/SURF4 family)
VYDAICGATGKTMPTLQAPRFIKALYHFIRILLAAVFLYTGVTKLADISAFAETIGAYGLLPEFLLPFAALGLVAAEIAAGIGLLMEKGWSIKLSAGLMLLFLAVLGYGMALGLDVDCGCYGPGDPEAEAFGNLRGAFIRDLFYLAGIALIVLYRKRYGAPKRISFTQRYPNFLGALR